MSTFDGVAGILSAIINHWCRTLSTHTLHAGLRSMIIKFYPFNSEPVYVIDAGSDTIKAGTATSETRQMVIPSVISYDDNNHETMHFAEEAINRLLARQARSLSRPLEHRAALDWKEIGALFEHVITGLHQLNATEDNLTHWDARHVPVVCTEKANNPSKCRQKLTEIMFESCRVSSFLLVCDAILTLLTTSRTFGCVVSMGHERCYSVPIKDGLYVSKAVQTYDIGGKPIVEATMSGLCERGYDLAFQYNDRSTYNNYKICRDVMEKLSFIVPNYALAANPHCTCTNPHTPHCYKDYELPDGQVITVDLERYKPAEILFTPSLRDPNVHDNVADMVACSIQETGFTVKQMSELYRNIVLTGGISQINGLESKLEMEMKDKYNVAEVGFVNTSRQHRMLDALLGGYMMASMEDTVMQQRWVSSLDYFEHGPSVIDKKCNFQY